jgi:hypothetical protein
VEAYILDNLRRRVAVIDTFESFIWTERFKDIGDFEMVLLSTNDNRTRLTVGTTLAMNNSYRMMIIETVQDKTDSDGRKLLTLTGRSFEEILDRRVAKDTLADLTAEPKWLLTGTPTVIVRKIFHDICVLGQLSVRDIIPGVVEDSIFPEDTISEPTGSITVELEVMTVYEAIKNICDVYEIGFRFIRNFDTSQLYFDFYMGSDRTTAQSTLPAVVFSPTLDNLQNTTELATNAMYKNVAYVFSPAGTAVVYPDGIDPTDADGLERRVLLVKADDIAIQDPPDSAPVILAKLTQRGKEELSKNRRLAGFDGEISHNVSYKYGVDYNLGDLVEKRNDSGTTDNMQVTEQIFVSDNEGERSYPTLSLNTFITPGSWIAWDYNQVWADVPDTEHWADQP